MNNLPGPRRIPFTGKLHENFVVILAAAELYRGLRQAESIDASFDGLQRLRHGRLMNLRDGPRPKSKSVTGRVARRGRHIPNVSELLAEVVAKFRKPCAVCVAHHDVRVVHAAHFIVANVLAAQPSGDAIDHLVGLLGNGLLHLHLQNEVRATLEIQSELDLVRKIIF